MSGTMRAVVATRPGGPEVMMVREVMRPEPGRGEVRVRVAASGINRADLLQRRGAYPAPSGWPADVPGLEFSGRVDALGPGVATVSEGDRVMGIVGGGGYAEHVVTHERTLVPVPAGMPLIDAGAIPEAFMTAFDAVDLRCGLAAGETLLVHAAGSGVGTAGVQLGRAGGARTIGTSRTPRKLEQAGELGLDEAVEGGDADWPGRVLGLTGGRGVDVVLDLVGAPYVGGNLKVLAERARWIVVGVTGGSTAEVDLRALMARRASIAGTVLRARPLEEKAALAAVFSRRVVPLFERGALRPVVDGTVAPDEAGEAHARMEDNRTFGKLLIVWEEDPA